MSTFYVLPPRPLLGERFAGFLERIFPGLTWEAALWSNLADMIDAAICFPDVYLVHREELDGDDTEQALRDCFGAESGDEVVEVRIGPRPGELTSRRWQIRKAA